MKKFKILFVTILIFLLAVATSFALSYAWYVNLTQIGKIDAETKDLEFSYQLDDEEVNSVTYNVSNLAFFDIDNESELPYFNTMVTKITINLSNSGESDVEYDITFNSTKSQTKDGDTLTSSAFVCGFILGSDEELSADATTISDYLTGYDSTKTDYEFLYEGELLSTAPADTLSLYLFGVQEIDSASNDFLYTVSDGVKTEVNYQFTLIIKAVSGETDPEIIEGTTTTTTTQA